MAIECGGHRYLAYASMRRMVMLTQHAPGLACSSKWRTYHCRRAETVAAGAAGAAKSNPK